MDLIKIWKNKYKFFFALPALFFIILIFIIPNVLNFYYSFTDWNAYKDEINFVGFNNFLNLSNQGVLWGDLINSIQYALGVMIIQNLCALVLALALEKTARSSKTLRTIFFIPMLLSPLAIGYLFKTIFDYDGPINKILSFISGQDVHLLFLGSLKYTLFIVILVHSWKYIGLTALVYIAGLNLIPIELIEAAKIEGASEISIITKIKIPLIGPAFTFNLAMTLIGTLSTFELPLALTEGGPARASEVLNIYIFQLFGTGRLSYATGVSLVLFLTVLVFAIPTIILLRRREVEL